MQATPTIDVTNDDIITLRGVYKGPAILRGAYELQRWGGSVPIRTGYWGNDVGVTDADLRAQGDKIKAAIAWCASNGKYLELGDQPFDYLADQMDGTARVGLQTPHTLRGVIGLPGLSVLRNFAVDHPVLTLSRIGGTSNDMCSLGLFCGLQVYHGKRQGADARAGSTTSGSAVITSLPNVTDLRVAMRITGTGIPADARILSVDGPDQITISANATATGTPTLSFLQLSATGLRIGRMTECDIDHVQVSINSDYTRRPYDGINIGSNFWFSNRVGNLRINACQNRNFVWAASSATGNIFENLYINNVQTGLNPHGGPLRSTITGRMMEVTTSGTDIGHFEQLNFEWTALGTAAHMLLINNAKMSVGKLYTEGLKFTQAFSAYVSMTQGQFFVRQFEALNNWAAVAEGVTRMDVINASGGGLKVDVKAVDMRWEGGAERICDAELRMVNTTVAQGVRPHITMGFGRVINATGGKSFDSSNTSAVHGSWTYFRGFTHDPKGISFSDGMEIQAPAQATDFTHYGINRAANILVTSAFTGKLILSDKLTPSGRGSTTPRVPGDTVYVQTSSAGAVTVRNHDDTADLAVMGNSAERYFTWTGTAWALG